MQQKKTEILSDDPAGVERAAGILAEGGLIALPTETVYGLGADACNGTAVARIYTAKTRPVFNPLIVHCADLTFAQRYAVFDELALKLAARFWPGPLTLVLPLQAKAGLSSLVTAGLDTVALRVPAHPLAQRLLQVFDGPIAAPSANISGGISPTSAPHVLRSLSGRIDAVIDGGTSAVGLESTILRPRGNTVELLRPGGIPVEEIEAVTGDKIIQRDDPEKPLAPGQMASHYAPSTALRLNAGNKANHELLLGFGPARSADLNLSPNGDLIEAAANLFAHLHDLDACANANGKTTIAVMPVPKRGLGLAINDRLKRAAAPRH